MPGSAPPVRPRWSGLDGLRALAVLAVVGFHFAPGVVPGGFLGVDLFFVLSGYLITRMITVEFLRTGHFRFGNFYLRRARRLLPGLGVLLVLVLAAAAFWRDQLSTIRPAVAAAAGYVSNWWLSYAHQSYFVSAGRPSMLQHLWSLAVEEQFYLIWPLIAVAVLFLARRRTSLVATRWLAGVAVVLALASAAEMIALAVAQNVPYDTDASRLYYGTDTHSSGLLLGAAFGAIAAGARRPGTTTWRWRPVWFTDLIALYALVALGVVVFTVSEVSPGLYRDGGFLAVAVLASLTTAGVARGRSRVGQALDQRPLRWLAARSYAIYLWHWPVAVVTRPGVDLHWPAPAVLLTRTVLTLALADLSYRLVEAPIRRMGFRAAIRRAADAGRAALARRGTLPGRLAAAVVATAVLLAGAVLIAGPKPALSATQRALAANQGGRALSIGPTTPRPAPTRSPSRRVVLAENRAGEHPVAGPPPSPPPTQRPRPAPPGPLPPISAFGDSVMLGARQALAQEFPGGTLDAVEGRQADPILDDVQQDAAAGRLHPLVLIGVGDNGLINPDVLRSTLACLHGVPQVVVINLRVDRAWQDPNNDTLASIVPQFHNVRLLDWHAESATHPSWFYDDGIHLTPVGAIAYTQLIVGLVERAWPQR